jgi:hypothetical protein
MVTPRKLHPKQCGRKSENKMPMFVDDNQDNDSSEHNIKLLMKIFKKWDDDVLDDVETCIRLIREQRAEP